MKKRTYIRQDKLIKELKFIYDSLYGYAKIVATGSNHSTIDVSLMFTLEKLRNLIEKLSGTYKPFNEKFNDMIRNKLKEGDKK